MYARAHTDNIHIYKVLHFFYTLDTSHIVLQTKKKTKEKEERRKKLKL